LKEQAVQFEPIKQSRIADEVYDRLKRSIVSRDLRPGMRLPSERDLADQFQVNRMAIREALVKLEHAGFMTTRLGPGGGVFVVDDLGFQHLTDVFEDLYLMNKFNISEIYEVRLILEPEIVRNAAPPITPTYVERLKDCINAESDSVSSDQLLISQCQFHATLAELSGNQFLVAVLASIAQLTLKALRIIGGDPLSIHPKGQHDRILEALIAGDYAAAAEAIAEHAAEIRANLRRAEENYRRNRLP
jgi:GntR family transcriptional regulator, transcriptional repressor for pyruvate dehydrogenase complex